MEQKLYGTKGPQAHKPEEELVRVCVRARVCVYREGDTGPELTTPQFVQ